MKHLFLLIFLLSLSSIGFADDVPWRTTEQNQQLLVYPEQYNDASLPTIYEKLIHRIQVQPANLFFLLYFILAIVHTFVAHRFHMIAKRRAHKQAHHKHPLIGMNPSIETEQLQTVTQARFFSHLLDYFGKVEVVFGLWCIPLLLTLTYFYSWNDALKYVDSKHYEEALFMIVAMAIASTYPIIHFADYLLQKIARLGGSTPTAWWFTILTFGVLMGSLIKETVSMTICAILIDRHFFSYRPTPRIAYATISLLFMNIAMGGMLTAFGTSAVSVISKGWKWDTSYMFSTFGITAFFGIVIVNLAYYFWFKSDFQQLPSTPVEKDKYKQRGVPLWTSVVNFIALGWIIFNFDNIIIALGSFVLFLGFYHATAVYQKSLDMMEPILIGFFIASLIIMTGLQVWWVEPLITGLSAFFSTKVIILLSAVTHNTSISYLLLHVPDISSSLKNSLFYGLMIGGGLSLMGNSPNLVAYSILGKHFNQDISLRRLFITSIPAAVIMYICFYVSTA